MDSRDKKQDDTDKNAAYIKRHSNDKELRLQSSFEFRKNVK
ncbi:hypothetical protein GMES_2871 [Paraglaciecola mesophila KMM 241]|uniref:Uncharacterized protein n=1 Tax=Paraglaciecola mesophila KMM 241 TaxID=1128912 RepID=K6YMB7_9ALTE|nr:hypothetical protein GMES_2871 [Paraglaciecola mesophila KMM 241]